MTETKTRSLVRSIVWRICATLITLAVVYAFTGNIGQSSGITLVAAALSMAAYYGHERIWNRIVWGRIPPPEPFKYPPPTKVYFDPSIFGGKPVMVYKNDMKD